MMLYDCAGTPSGRRVRIFFAEKQVSVPVTQVDLRAGEQRSAAFLAINPEATVPVLKLDSGARLADAIAICHYFEETHPDPRLCGDGPEGRAVVTAWQRRMERDGFYAVMEAFRNASLGHVGRGLAGPVDYPQIPALAERGRARTQAFFAMLDERLAANAHVAGVGFSIADITAFVTVEWAAARLGLQPPETAAHLRRWRAAIAARPGSVA